jgi:hypothetical protein
LRTGCGGEYLELRRRKWQEVGEDCILRSFTTYIIKVIKTRSMRWAGHLTYMGYMDNALKSLVRKPEGKRPLRRLGHICDDNIKMDLRRECDDNIKMDLRRREWEGVDCK